MNANFLFIDDIIIFNNISQTLNFKTDFTGINNTS